MTLDTENTIYICTDRDNEEVRVLYPRNCQIHVVELNLSDRNPESTDAAEYKLLAEEMESITFEL